MASTDPHTLKAFDDDLEEIRAAVSQAGGLAEDAVRGAIYALMRQDQRSAAQVIGADYRIDQCSKDIEAKCIRVIALRAPMADDLRAVLASFKIAILLERVGDCARSIAEQVHLIGTYEHRSGFRLIESTAAAASEMICDCLDAFTRQDAAKAAGVPRGHDTVRGLSEQLFREALDAMVDNPSQIRACTSLLLVSQKLERISDHASNIGRIVYFSETGDQLGEGRPPAVNPTVAEH